MQSLIGDYHTIWRLLLAIAPRVEKANGTFCKCFRHTNYLVVRRFGTTLRLNWHAKRPSPQSKFIFKKSVGIRLHK